MNALPLRAIFSCVQLFRIVVDYGQNRTEGMTEADMIEAISAVYGTPAGRLARQKKERDDRSTAAEKARATNKGTFKP